MALNVKNVTTTVKTSSTSRVFESAIQQENEKARHKNLEKSEGQGTLPLLGEGVETESNPALLYFSRE